MRSLNKIRSILLLFLGTILILAFTTAYAIATPSQLILADFETNRDVKNEASINAKYELSSDHVTSGNYSILVKFSVEYRYPEIRLKLKGHDWSPYTYFKIDIFNPFERRIKTRFLFSDSTTHEWSSHCRDYVYLECGKNTVKLDISSIKRIKWEIKKDKYP